MDTFYRFPLQSLTWLLSFACLPALPSGINISLFKAEYQLSVLAVLFANFHHPQTCKPSILSEHHLVAFNFEGDRRIFRDLPAEKSTRQTGFEMPLQKTL